jgi:hypothetical protein
MANEVQVQLSFRASKGGATIAFQDSFRQSMTGNELVNQTQRIGTGTPEPIDVGQVDEPYGQMVIKNLDSTNYITIFQNTEETGLAIKINPGKFALFSTDGQAIYAKADTAEVRILTLTTSE